MQFLSFTSDLRPALPFSLLLLASSSIVHDVSAQQSYSISSLDTKQIRDLTAACSTVYTSTISGCAMSDFVPMNSCSPSCISGLTAVQTNAQTACQDNNIPDESILSYFTMGQAVNQLCAVSKMVGSSSTMTTTTRTGSIASPSASVSPTSSSTGVMPITPASATGPPTSTPPPATGLLALPRMTLIAIIVGAVVGCMLLALITFCAFRVNYK